MTRYTYSAGVEGSIEDVRPVVEAALRAEDFGVLTEIDVAATLKAKLDLDRPAYLILGACNPRLAHRALEADPSIGALLPCNVVLREDEQTGRCVVEILDPLAALGIADATGIETIAADAAERLQRVLQAIVDETARASVRA